MIRTQVLAVERLVIGTIIALLVALLTVVPVPGLSTTGVASASPQQVWERVFSNDFTVHSSVTVADISGDGVNDIVVGTHGGWVRVFRADGSDLPGWPRRISIGGTHTGIDAAVTVADLDRDGRNEVIVGAGTLRHKRQHGGLVVFNRDGSVRWTFRTQDRLEGGNGYTDAVFSTPAVGDVTGDGFPNIVFGAFDHFIYVLDRHGRNVPGSPFFSEDTVFSSPALADVTNNGRNEIFIGGDSSPGGFAPAGGIMWSIEFRDGRLQERWRRHVGEIIISSPAVGDITGDGTYEVVFGTGDFWKTADSKRVFAVRASNGATVTGWPVTTGGYGWSSPAVGDLTGDGRLDVAIGARDGVLYAFRGDGNRLWAVNPAQGTAFTSGIITGGPIIADVNGNGRLEVVSATGNAVFARAGHDGALIDTFSTHWQYQNSPAIAKFGKEWRIVTAGYLDASQRMRVASHRIPAPKKASPWPMFGRDAAHTGTAPLPRPKAKGGYWVLDTAGEVYAFGKAEFHGSVAGVRATNPNVGAARSAAITRTPSGKGYWVLDAAGGIFSFGDARFHGSVPQLRAKDPNIGQASTIGLAPTPSGKGYWILDAAGGIFTFGDARFHGSVPGLRQAGVSVGPARVVTLASTPSGKGYWILDEFGGMFSFGDARFFGSVPGLRQQGIPVGPARIVGMASTKTGNGYWLVDEFGGMFAFGDAKFHGSIPQLRQKGVPVGSNRIVGMVPTSSGNGYWLLDEFGGVFAFGDAGFFGSVPALGVQTRVAGLAPAG